MPGPPASDPTRFRGRRIFAGCGVITSIAALVTLAIGVHRQPVLGFWLLISGLALAALSVHAMRGERAALELLDARRAERDRAESARRAAESRTLELAETSPDLLT